MRFLNWEPSERVAFWGKRVVLGIIAGSFWTIELLAATLILGSLSHTIHPGLQTGQDWTNFLLLFAFWTPFTLVVSFAVRADWPKVADRSPSSPRKS